jgi:mannose-1-phosphate guanylyltransferase
MKQADDNMRWSIVIADDHGPEWAPQIIAGADPAPVQYCRLGESHTLLQKTLHRALNLAPASRVLVTALQDYRSYWEPALWFVRTENRFICDQRSSSSLAAAAALLSIASRMPSAIVTMLPARCFVADEPMLRRALEQALAVLPQLPEGVVTLGMLELDDGSDENYLVPGHGDNRPGLVVHGYARQPVPWVARYLRQQGAMVASGILIGYAGVFAAHISQHWPGLTRRLMNITSGAAAAGAESEIRAELQQGVPTMVLRSLRWYPPSFPQRVLPVRRCGWSGLNSARAVARISECAAARPRPVPQHATIHTSAAAGVRR